MVTRLDRLARLTRNLLRSFVMITEHGADF
jgi:hypothetical protein